MSAGPVPSQAFNRTPNFCFGTRMCSQPEAGGCFDPGFINTHKQVYLDAPINGYIDIDPDIYRGHGDPSYSGWVSVLGAV